MVTQMPCPDCLVTSVAYRSQTLNLQTLLRSTESVSYVDILWMICMKHNSKVQLLDPSSVPSRQTTTSSDEDAKRMSSHYPRRVLIWDQLVVQEQLYVVVL